MISFAITVKNEIYEFDLLINKIKDYIKDDDEVVVVQDFSSYKGSKDEIQNIILNSNLKNTNYKLFNFNGDFSELKNFLIQNCTKEYIFQLDADEYPNKSLLANLHHILKTNSKFDLFWLGRINIVNGITDDYINNMGWNKNEKNYINFPDPQQRIWKNKKDIKYQGKVHERLVGYKIYSKLPFTEDFCLMHIKSFDKQISQNNFYSKIQ